MAFFFGAQNLVSLCHLSLSSTHGVETINQLEIEPPTHYTLTQNTRGGGDRVGCGRPNVNHVKKEGPLKVSLCLS